MKSKKKKLTNLGKIRLMKKMLLEIQGKYLFWPDSDKREYCPGCKCSPWWEKHPDGAKMKIPGHIDGCIVPRLSEFLKRV